MSASTVANAAPSPREVDKFRRRSTIKLANRERTFQPCRAGSLDVNDPRSKPGRPFGDGTVEGGKCTTEMIMLTVREWNRETRIWRKPCRLSKGCLDTLEGMLSYPDYASGDWTIGMPRLAAEIGTPLRTVERHIAKLGTEGVIAWVTRTIKTGGVGPRGAEVRQTSNSYKIPEAWPDLLQDKLKELQAIGKATWAGIRQIAKKLRADAKARGDEAVALAQECFAKRIAKLRLAHDPKPETARLQVTFEKPSDRRATAYDRDPATIAMRLHMETFFDDELPPKLR